MNFAQTKSSAPAFRGLVTACLAVLALLAAGCSAGSESLTRATWNGWPVEEVAAEVGPSVAQVNVHAVQMTPFGPQEGRGVGSGMIYREDGYIITNSHVVEGVEEVNVAFADGTLEEGEVVGRDPFTEIAVVKVSREVLPAANFVENPNLAVGELVVAVGSPSGFQSTVSVGVISGLNREVPARLTRGRQEAALVDLIQTDAAISPGSSGGALANTDAEVIGITVAYLPPAQTGAVNIGFAIPSDTAISVADQIIETGEATHPYLGVSLTNLNPQVAERFGIPVETGALVTEADPNGPAYEAGIRRETVITAVGSEKVETSGDLLVALREYRPGDRVTLTVVEDGDEREVEVELGERS
jgi:serine protease Do